MEIKSISVKHWKYFDFDKGLDLKPGINLILGKNGSGKTSFLRMIQDASAGQAQNLSGLSTDTPEGTNLVTINLNDGTNDISMINQKSGENGTWTTNTLTENVRYITSQRSITSGNNARNPLVRDLGDISVSAPNQTIDVAEEFNKAIIKELFDKVSELTQSTGFLSDLEKAYQDELVDFEKNLKIDPKRENAVFFVDHKDREVAVNDLSSGEKEYLYFYAFLRRIRTDEGKIILIDEPELHLHSSQIRKLCELISVLSLKNQVIIATHSGEVLQHFISRANIVLLSKGVVNQIDNPDQMQKVLEETGLPIDPSVFTAHWICAENEPSKTLPGGGATTPEVLEWILGKDLKKRYWSFGSNRAVAQAYGSGIATTGSTGVTINVTVILDGDKLMKSPSDYCSVEVPEPTKDVSYFPFWELENIFLSEAILNEVIPEKDGKNGFNQLWDLISTNKATLLNTVKKTVAKNSLREYSLDKYIDSDPTADIQTWKDAVQNSTVDMTSIDTAFDEVLTQKKWQWLPGKEVLSLVVSNLETDFWTKIRVLQQENKLAQLFEKDNAVKSFIEKVNALI